MSSFLSESARVSFAISGAIDEDHNQLAILEDEVNRTDVLIDRLFKEVTNDVHRQTNYVSTERANLNLMSAGIKVGEIYGGRGVNVAMAGAVVIIAVPIVTIAMVAGGFRDRSKVVDWSQRSSPFPLSLLRP